MIKNITATTTITTTTTTTTTTKTWFVSAVVIFMPITITIFCNLRIYLLTFCAVCRISRKKRARSIQRHTQHFNIVSLLAVICEHNHYGIVMEYLLHRALDDFIFTYEVSCSVCCSCRFIYHLVLVKILYRAAVVCRQIYMYLVG